MVELEAQELLVQQYKHLRQRDSSGNAKSSWRITVRQLESMLRLSEAFARLHCCEEVTAKHVKEAYRLLNKSIIRVDQPDVDLDEDDAPVVEEEAQEEAMETNEQEPNKKQFKLSYEKYKKRPRRKQWRRMSRSPTRSSSSSATRSTRRSASSSSSISGGRKLRQSLQRRRRIVLRLKAR